MYKLTSTIVSAILLTTGCMVRNFSEGTSKKSLTTASDTATIKIETTSVSKLVRVIGIEEDEGACVGGNPKHVFEISPGAERIFEMPISVKKIGLCGQARPDGMDFKHIEVSLEKNVRYVIREDKLEKEASPIKSGFSRIRIQSTSVQQLIRVIGIEKNEAACVGGNPKYVFDVKAENELVFDFPVSVKKIGLCGQARPNGMEYKHLEVLLKDGASYIIKGDEIKEE